MEKKNAAKKKGKDGSGKPGKDQSLFEFSVYILPTACLSNVFPTRN